MKAALAALLLLVGCRGNRLPDGVLDADRMVDFLSEAYLLEGYYSVATQFAYDTVPPEVAGAYAALLDRMGISQGEVDSSFEYYAKHVDAYAAIQERVQERLQ